MKSPAKRPARRKVTKGAVDALAKLRKRVEGHLSSDSLVRFPARSLVGIKMSKRTREVLMRVGLPSSAAPSLSFEVPYEGALQTINDAFGGVEGQPETLRMLGSDGSGNPICFDATKDRIVLCDHERDFKPIPMNSSVERLLLSLAAYGEWWDANAGDAEPSRAARAELRATLSKIDPSAWTRGAFWTGA